MQRQYLEAHTLVLNLHCSALQAIPCFHDLAVSLRYPPRRKLANYLPFSAFEEEYRMKSIKHAWLSLALFAMLAIPLSSYGRTASRDVPGPGPLAVSADVPGPGPLTVSADVPGPGPLAAPADVPGPGPLVVTADVPGPGPLTVSADVPGPGPLAASADVPGPGPLAA
jgi:hypothetical protein